MLSRIARSAITAAATKRTAQRSVVCSLSQPHLCGPQCHCGRRMFSDAEPRVFKINTLKEGTDPVELPDSEYPDWLWTIARETPSESELLDKGLANLSREELAV